jgi:hypothetical protein
MELHLWRVQFRWPRRLYLGTIGWNLQTWQLESGPSPVSEDRAELLFAIVDALTTMEPPAVRTEKTLRRALVQMTETAEFRTSQDLKLKYGPVLDPACATHASAAGGRAACGSAMLGGAIQSPQWSWIRGA